MGKMTKRLKKLVFLMVALVSAIALYACTGGKQGESDSSSDPIGGEPANGGSVVVGIQQDIDSLDLHLSTSAGTREILFNIYEGLVKPDEVGNLIPAIASDYEISEDGKVYTFILRDGVKFHNGQLVTAEDVKYSIERNAEGEKPIISAFANIESVNIKDTSMVELVLSEADTELMSYMIVAIVPKDHADLKSNPIGTGPFKLASYVPGQKLVLEKFEDYWQKGYPYLDQVEFRIFANTDAALLELKSGSIDICPYLTQDQADVLANDYQILAGNMNIVQALYLNNDHGPFQDVRVRRALCHAIDRENILKMLSGGRGTVIGSNMIPGLGKYFASKFTHKYEHDQEQAKELLADAGYTDGFEFTIKVPSNYKFHVDTAQIIADQLENIGVTAKIELIEWTSWKENVYSGREFEATIIGIDPKLSPKELMSRYTSDASQNFINFKNSEFDDVLKKAVATTLDNEKMEHYAQLQFIMAEEAASVFIQDPALLVAMNKKLAGYKFYPLYVQDMSTVYFVK